MVGKEFIIKAIKIAIVITIVSILYKMVSYIFPEFFEPYETWVLNILKSVRDGVMWLYSYSLEIFLVWAGRFSRDFKNNVKGYFSAIVLFSTFRLNLARSKALKESKGETSG